MSAESRFFLFYVLLSVAPIPDPNLLFIPLRSLSEIGIGDEGAAAIGEGLKHNKTLSTLE